MFGLFGQNGLLFGGANKRSVTEQATELKTEKQIILGC